MAEKGTCKKNSFLWHIFTISSNRNFMGFSNSQTQFTITSTQNVSHACTYSITFYDLCICAGWRLNECFWAKVTAYSWLSFYLWPMEYCQITRMKESHRGSESRPLNKTETKFLRASHHTTGLVAMVSFSLVQYYT